MKFRVLKSRYLNILIGLLSVNNALAFDVEREFKSNPIIGTRAFFVIRDAPKLVHVKFAVQTPNNTLQSIESSTNYNVTPSTSLGTLIEISGDLSPGINYYIVVVDAENPNNYATNGPFAMSKLGGALPSTSATSKSGTTYSTAAPPSATGQTSSKTTETNSSTGLNVGLIAGIAVGAAVGGAIIAVCVFCLFFKKRRQPPQPVVARPVTRPNQKINNNSKIPLTAPTSKIVEINSVIKPTSTTTTAIPTPKQPKINATAINSSPATLSTALPEHSSVDALNVSSETTFKYQYPANFNIQPEYPPYVYTHNSHQYNMSSYPPSGDSMPIPEHHFEANNAYPPLSPTFYNYPQPYPPYSQPYPPYPPHQSVQINAASNSSYPSPTAAKTEESTSKTADSPLAQKVEYDGNTADSKFEYHQKPDAAVDEHSVHSKPNQKNSI